MPISLQNFDDQKYSIVRIDGKFNAISVAEVRKCVECAVHLGNKNIVFDMSKVTILDSAGIGCIMAVQKLLVEQGGKLYLVSIPPNITGLLKSSSANKVLNIMPSLVDAESILNNGVIKQERGFYVLFKMPVEFNLSTVKPLRAAIDEAKKKGYMHTVFDFERCKVITSVGIGLLVNVHKELADKSGGVHLLNLTPEVQTILQTTHILSVIKAYKTLDEIDEELMSKPL
jgi:anti-anti-sigma factor